MVTAVLLVPFSLSNEKREPRGIIDSRFLAALSKKDAPRKIGSTGNENQIIKNDNDNNNRTVDIIITEW